MVEGNWQRKEASVACISFLRAMKGSTAYTPSLPRINSLRDSKVVP